MPINSKTVIPVIASMVSPNVTNLKNIVASRFQFNVKRNSYYFFSLAPLVCTSLEGRSSPQNELNQANSFVALLNATFADC